ncbi:UNVERIFIED_CONTAM: hypothetical protein Slati_3928900 [Sesamum latifolium]|uniref:DUF4283 domain-containing protein n=1 Tax=Sesamum latifolium TaxID=2727402 RepID=A0AAW2TMI7_9LAMI
MLDPIKGVDIRRLEEGRFLLCFNHIIDRNCALDGCPWSFEKNTLILSNIGINENPQQVNLDWCEFVVHVHDLPLSKMNFVIVSLIGNALVQFRDMEMEESDRAWGSTLRMRVAFNVTQPLIRVLRHIHICCALHFEDGFHNPGEEMPYGAWLRAPSSSWGTRKPRQTPSPSSTSRRPHPNLVRGPRIFDFGSAHKPMQSAVERGKTVVPDASDYPHSK